MSAAAFQGCFADFKIVRGRKVAQLVVEVPLETADAALAALGGLPNPATETWVAIARLQPAAVDKPGKPRNRWHDLLPAQQAAIRCTNDAFRRFVAEREQLTDMPSPEIVAEFIRDVCGVKSRADLNNDPIAEAKWRNLDDEFVAWFENPEFV
jgi:hypothetical protein